MFEIPTFIYYRQDGQPRNYVEPIINESLPKLEQTRALLQAKIDAFKKTQRRFGVGIVAGMGAVQNAIYPPDSVIELSLNFTVPAAVQGLSYLSFRKAIHLMRQEIQPHISFE